MAQRGLSRGVIALIVIVGVLVVVLIALLITHPEDPAGQQSRDEPAATQPAEAEGADEGAGDEEAADDDEAAEEDSEPAVQPPSDALSDAAFATPSRNIWCQIGADDVTCTIGGYEYQVPDQPECDGQYGRVLQWADEEVSMPCLPDAPPTTAPESLPDLDYGQSTVANGIWCASEESGVTCQSVQTGTGFSLAYGEFSTF